MGTGKMKRAFLLLALLALASACFGPKPRIVRETVSPPEEKGGAWLLAITIANDGPGDGGAEVTSRLRDPHGAVVAQEQRELELKPHETVTVTLEMHPATPGPYRPESNVQAPPE